MNKNLKKVISAVIALALSVGSAAMAAPSFTDVAETASYAQAVNTLAALGVIAGYEDGTFKPDSNITRAEVATMVVAALNRSADAEGAKGTTKFDDVNTDAKAWASGFVNIGVSEGFISGYDDGSFKPDNNVTYAEMVSMLVRVAGYGRYAEYLGGWPNGYLSVGNDKGVTKGVSAGADVAVTRAQVAQMIYNTLMDVPVVESTTLTTDSNGNLVPEMTIMDGKNDNDYKTLLTEKHDAYYVEGHVSATNRTNSARIDSDEVEFTIEYTENYDDSDVVIKKGSKNSNGDPIVSTEVVYSGSTDAANYLFTYASAIIKIDDNDDATLISFIPSGRNKVDSFETNLVDDDSYYDDEDTDTVDQTTVFTESGAVQAKPYVKYYETKSASKSQKYNLDPTFELYVNGVEVTANKTNFENYVIGNEAGKVEYIDRYSATQKADGYYDLVFVTYYATAQVDSVNTKTGKVIFDDAYNNGRDMYIVLDPEDEDIAFDILYNGEEIELSGLLKYDVISIAYDVEAGLLESDFFEIHVSRDTAEGKYTGKNADDEVVTIGGKAYEFVKGFGDEKGLNMSDEYTLYLDAFGRIFTYETLASSAKLAVVDKYSKASADDYHRALLYTTDGSAKNLEVDTTKVTNLKNEDILKKVYKDTNGNGTIETSEIASDNKTDIQDRVVKYKISSSSGRIISLEFVDGNMGSANYRANAMAIGSVRMNEATKVIDALDYVVEKAPTYSDLSISSVAGFVADTDYIVYGYGDKNSDNTYPMVIVVDAGGEYTFETNFAVVSNTPGEGVDATTGDDIYNLEVLYQGAEYANNDADEDHDALIVNDDVTVSGAKTDIKNLAKGDIIVFTKDGAGNVKKIEVLLTAAVIGTDSGYDTVAKNAFDNTVASKIMIPAGASNWTKSWYAVTDEPYDPTNKTGINQGKEVTRLVYGPVVENGNNTFSIGSFTTGKVMNDAGEEVYDGKYTDLSLSTGDGSAIEIDISSDANVYVWDYYKSSKQQLGLGTYNDVKAASIADSYLLKGGDIIPWNNAGVKDNANFAFAKVVDGEATDVFVILSK